MNEKFDIKNFNKQVFYWIRIFRKTPLERYQYLFQQTLTFDGITYKFPKYAQVILNVMLVNIWLKFILEYIGLLLMNKIIDHKLKKKEIKQPICEILQHTKTGNNPNKIAIAINPI